MGRLLLGVLLIFTAAPAWGLSKAFEGKILSVTQDTLGIGVGPGAFITGQWNHGDCADQGCRDFYSPSEAEGNYFDFSVQLDATLGSFDIISQAFGFSFDQGVLIQNGLAGVDRYNAHFTAADGIIGPEPVLPGFFLVDFFMSFSVDLQDDDGTVFDSGFIPPDLALDQFEIRTFSIDLFADFLSDSSDEIQTRRYSASGIMAPEPSSAVLTGLGLAGLGAWRRARPRRASR